MILVGVSVSSVWNATKLLKFKPYKIGVFINFLKTDYEQRLRFCNWYLKSMNDGRLDPQMLTRLVMKPVLVEETTLPDIPRHLQVLLSSLESKNDAIVALLYVLMLETGFLPQHEMNCTLYKGGHGFNVQILNRITDMPLNWRNAELNIYDLTFGLGAFPKYTCKLLVVPSGEILLVNLVITNLDKERKAYSMTIQPSKYITNLSGHIAYSLNNMKDLSVKFKDTISNPAKCAILNREGMLNPSILGVPDEMKIRIFKNLAISDMNNVSLVCRKLFALSKDQSLWRHYVSRDFLCREVVEQMNQFSVSNSTMLWKEQYIILFSNHICEVCRIKPKKKSIVLNIFRS
ncbi:hypothetical protein C0J52_05932 [Blattella germanica]|nr:hypothetical protein C0J52_05932 [Blattella germanica]